MIVSGVYPRVMTDDGSWGCPDGLGPEDYFQSRESCEDWLMDNGYDLNGIYIYTTDLDTECDTFNFID